MWEIVLILVVALIVLGPRQLAETARALGKFYREIQRFTSEVRETINTEISTIDHKPPVSHPAESDSPKPEYADQELAPMPGEKSGPDFYADLLESSKESDEEKKETEQTAEAQDKGPESSDHQKEESLSESRQSEKQATQ
ncbi:MAG: twin-arginine translocase TatA/TatE family subunit [Deltaproteobacteria bacterium]|nr:twin-arginine translocase TatA/TatE family subunit [Deltaproteobacteria bacterium]